MDRICREAGCARQRIGRVTDNETFLDQAKIGARLCGILFIALLLGACGGSDSKDVGTAAKTLPELPKVNSVKALSRRYVEVEFDAAADPEASGNPSNYTITLPNDRTVPVIAAIPSDDARSVLLSIKPSDEDLQLIPNGTLVFDLTEVNDEPIVFTGNGSEEPTVKSIAALNDTTLVVEFSEPVTDMAGYLENYQIKAVDGKSLPVVAATLSRGGEKVVLNTGPQNDTSYLMRVYGVKGKVNQLPLYTSGSDDKFMGMSRLTGLDMSPSVVSAASLDNTHVVVVFNKPMDVGAEHPVNYRINQETVNTEAGGVTVLQAGFLNNERTAVVLTTRSQNEVKYRVTVINVSDTYGLQLKVTPGFSDILSATSSVFAGTPPGVDTLVDSDGDGLFDNEEQAGYTVLIEMANGDLVSRQVTSDPDNVDTDGDGVSDGDELQYGMNPRATDTDGDRLNDNLELNTIFSNPYAQDTDADGLQDGFEHFDLKTSPLLADTDGDKLKDNTEFFELNRDPLIADLPRLSIDVGDIRLQLDERYSYTDETGNTVSQESSSNTTLSQSDTTSYSKSDVTTKELTGSGTLGFEVGNTGAFGAGNSSAQIALPSGKAFGSATVSNTDGTLEQIDKGSAQESQKAYENSITKGEEFSTTSTVTREVIGARIDVDLSIRNTGNVPFTVSNLEITVLEPSPTNARQFVPVATLVSNSELITGSPLVVNLGPFSTERGPFVFASREVFPNLVEALMRDPQGLIFRVANYDVTDELGRNFVYSNQVARDRTVGIVIDLGDADAAQSYYVASSGALDDQGFTGASVSVYLGGFSANGRAKGLPLDYLLQARLGLAKHESDKDAIAPGPNGVLDSVRVGDDVLGAGVIETGPNGWLETIASADDIITNPTARDGIVAGLNKTADSVAQGDDIQLVPRDTTGLSLGTIVIGAGDNGVLDTPALDDDRLEFVTGYETARTCNALSANAGDFCRLDSDCPSRPDAISTTAASCTGPQRLSRVNSLRSGDLNRDWFVLSSGQIPAAADFGTITVNPGDNIILAFLQDLDRDGLFGRDEFLIGTIDSSQDELTNNTFGVDETLITCAVPTADGCDGLADSKDSDRDGLGDFAEARIGWKVSVGGDVLRQVYPNPSLRDTDGDGLLDPVEQDVSAYCSGNDPRVDGLCAFLDSLISAPQNEAVAIVAGENATVDSVAGDTNGDGLLDSNDADSDDIGVLVQGGSATSAVATVIQPGPNGKMETLPLSDDLYISSSFVPPATDPSLQDTDQDRVTDFDELTGYRVGRSIRDGGNNTADTARNGDDVQRTPLNNPTLDNGIIILPGPNGKLDSVAAGDDQEIDGEDVTTDPLRRDTDHDNNTDGIEIVLGSNPAIPDGDQFRDDDRDGLSNAQEALGWSLAAIGPGFVPILGVVVPSSNLVDTDSDGLPDFIERDLRTNPNLADTDKDGISDYDEVDEFARYASLMMLYPNVVVDGSGSARFGTSPLYADSDFDLLTDYEELVGGFRMTLPGDSAPQLIFTDPLQTDTDGDGVIDFAEVNRVSNGVPAPTDPTNNDTDGDGRTESQELASGSDPRVPDVAVTIAFEKVGVDYVTGDGANGTAEFTWWFTSRGPTDTTPVLLTSPSCTYLDDSDRCGFTWPDLGHQQCFETVLYQSVSYSLPLKNSSRQFVLQPGQSFRIEGLVGEIDTVSADCGLPPYYIPSGLGDDQGGAVGCVAQISELFTYERLVGQQGTQLIEIEKTNACVFNFQYSVTLN